MDEHKIRKVVILSLASTLLALLFFIFGRTLSKGNILLDLVYYILSIAMLLISVLALYNNNKIQKNRLFQYLILVNVLFMALLTLYMAINHLA
ncbi:hypothetical protein FYJ79_02420 [Sharpea azabuensis]|uniref:Uncharacterized protein n=1 Tax=Sharpea porci TaxID=2652286 RepID=A0A844FS82_9FIRM|nr:hypothetical protein [Sharpea porci]MDY5278624.1 hypothetical protein [Sharpea porci]MST88446.1 hypothetical protein [Sharpea porci]